MSKVIIQECKKYELEALIGKINAAVDILGGWDKYVKPGNTVRRCQVVVEFLLDNSPDVMQPNPVADHKTGSGSVLQY